MYSRYNPQLYGCQVNKGASFVQTRDIFKIIR